MRPERSSRLQNCLVSLSSWAARTAAEVRCLCSSEVVLGRVWTCWEAGCVESHRSAVCRRWSSPLPVTWRDCERAFAVASRRSSTTEMLRSRDFCSLQSASCPFLNTASRSSRLIANARFISNEFSWISTRFRTRCLFGSAWSLSKTTIGFYLLLTQRRILLFVRS